MGARNPGFAWTLLRVQQQVPAPEFADLIRMCVPFPNESTVRELVIHTVAKSSGPLAQSRVPERLAAAALHFGTWFFDVYRLVSRCSLRHFHHMTDKRSPMRSHRYGFSYCACL